MNCDNCKYLAKEKKNGITVLQCKKDMIKNKEDINEESIKQMKCGYFNQRIEGEQLTLF